MDLRWPLRVCIFLQVCFTAISGNVQLLERRNMTMETPTESNSPQFAYCQDKPRFRAGNGSILSYLMRLNLCSATENNDWLAEACEKRTYAFTHYYRLDGDVWD